MWASGMLLKWLQADGGTGIQFSGLPAGQPGNRERKHTEQGIGIQAPVDTTDNHPKLLSGRPGRDVEASGLWWVTHTANGLGAAQSGHRQRSVRGALAGQPSFTAIDMDWLPPLPAGKRDGRP